MDLALPWDLPALQRVTYQLSYAILDDSHFPFICKMGGWYQSHDIIGRQNLNNVCKAITNCLARV